MILSKRKRPNVVLISVDTLRPAHLSCYGYRRDTAPNLKRLAREGVLFTNAFAQSSFTPSSHGSIFTSRYVSSFKADRCGYYFKNQNIPSLAELIRNSGYTTAGLVGGGWIASSRGFGRGFDLYDDNGGGIRTIVRKALRWLEKNYRRRFFLFLHCYDVHQYYSGGNQAANFKGADNIISYLWKVNAGQINLGRKDLADLIRLYDDAVSYVDNYIGKLLDRLKESGLEKDSLIVFLSDHGEAFYEHNLLFHCVKLYDEFIRMPLIMRYPFLLPENRKIKTQIQSIDIMPTILEILDIPPPEGIQGLSLIPLIKGERAKRIKNRTIFSESFGEDRYLSFLKGHGLNFDKRLKMIRTKDWKYIYNFDTKRGELFDLAKDSREQNNLAHKNRRIAGRLKEELFNWAEGLSPAPVMPRKELDKSDQELIREKLRSLGYL